MVVNGYMDELKCTKVPSLIQSLKIMPKTYELRTSTHSSQSRVLSVPSSLELQVIQFFCDCPFTNTHGGLTLSKLRVSDFPYFSE